MRDLRPLDPLRSIKAKLGVLVAASILLSSWLVAVGLRAGLDPVLAVLVALLASLAVTQVLAHGMTSPLREMTTAARAMARGDYSRRVRATSRDEVGELAVAFNRMATDLAEVDRQRKELVANVSHELRTPISALRAVLENVADGVVQPDGATLRTALEQTERLGRLVTTLLDLSRIDSGVLPLDREELGMVEFLGSVVREAEVALAAAGRDARIELDVRPERLAGWADRERLHQVMANLLDNACRHTPPGGRVTVAATPDTGGGIRLEVSDEGPGIPVEERTRVFERFTRGGGSAGDGGTGLGLAIARWVIDLHGGDIYVAGSERGCLIRVHLPGGENVRSTEGERRGGGQTG